MKKKPSFTASFRMTLGGQHIGWFRTDPTVDPVKAMHTVVEDHSEQVKQLLAGEITAVDELASSEAFFVNSKPAKTPKPDDNTFLGYVTTKHPSHAEVLVRIWPKLTFTNHAV